MATSASQVVPGALVGGPPVAPGAATGIGRRLPRRRFVALVIGLVALLVVGMLLAVGLGAVSVPPGLSARIVAHHLLPGVFAPAGDQLQNSIIWSFRMPRVLLSVIIGAGLALVGAVLQTVVRNPLADPFLLGVSSGASLAAVIVFVMGSSALGGLGLSSAAFAGALVSTAMVYLLAQRGGRLSPGRLILAGVALSYLFQAGYSYLLLRTQTFDGAESILFWLLGSVAGADWSMLPLPVIALTVGIGALLLQARTLNAVLGGEETAASLGVGVQRFQIQMLVVTSLVVGAMVAVSGAIAFVGLIMPHVARLLVGADHRRMLPVAALLGAAFLVLVDLVARTIDSPNELPLTIVTAMIGVPFFLWLLRRRQHSVRDAIG